jgi:CubicO group peptidase (beta-lactamase class C family)
MRTLVTSHFAKPTLSLVPVDTHVAFVVGIYNDTRGLDIHSIERSSNDEIGVIVAKNGKPLFKQAYGPASNIRNCIDSRFNIRIDEQMFSAIASAQLAERRKLSFSDPVGKYLPDFPTRR